MRLGILGSMVRDRIEHPDGPIVERWGGIGYALAAAAAALPSGWRVRPIMKLGEDLADDARAFLADIPGLELGAGLATTPEPNNRVHLRYDDRHHRRECLSGGVPPWTWEELEPRLQGLDALLVNLISGFELDLPTATRLRGACDGLLYADLHSLLLDRADGERRPRTLPERERWLACFDVVQLNEQELALVADADAPLAFARTAVGAGLGALLVTRGPAGATWIARGPGPAPWNVAGPVELAHVPLDAVDAAHGDPTGCGDVWGATCFIRLVLGQTLDVAVTAASRAAVRKLSHQGADGLYHHLGGGA